MGLQDCCKSKREESQELIPEALKNMLLVLASQDILTPHWRVRSLSPSEQDSSLQLLGCC